MRWAYLAASCLVLGACESDWFGDEPPPPLEGERIAILDLGSGLESDPVIENVPVELPGAEVNPEWPQFGGRIDKAMHHLAAPGSWQRVWSADIGSGQSSSRRLVGTPVVAGARIFTFDSGTQVSAFDHTTGDVLWRVDVAPEEEDDGWGGGLAFDDGRLFVTTGNGEVLALDPEDGNLIWRVTAGPPVRTPPAAHQGRVHFVTLDNLLVTLDAATGTLLWTHQGFLETASLLGGGSPSVAGSFVIATYSSGEVVTLRAENGRVVWRDSLVPAGQTGTLAVLNDINGSAVIDRGLVFVSSYGDRMVAIDLTQGVRVWEHALTGTQTPWVAGDYLWVVTVEGEVVCLLREDGRIRWITRLARYEDPEDLEDPIHWSGPVLAGERLLLTGTHGAAIVLNPSSGEILETLPLDRGLPLMPVIANERIYLVGASGTMIVLR